MAAESIEVVTYSRPEVFGWRERAQYPYQRVVAVRFMDGEMGEHLGDRKTHGRDERRLSLSQMAGQRLMRAFKLMLLGQLFNCHLFGRFMADQPLSQYAPPVDNNVMAEVASLSVGTTGYVVRELDNGNPYIVHSIGCGYGNEGLQVMSGEGGEFGFANNSDVLGFYQTLRPDRKIALYQSKPEFSGDSRLSGEL